MDHILLIDDEDAILDSISRVLTYLGYHVKVAHDGAEGIKLFKRGDGFDCVITGISMPKVDGNQVAEFIRNSDKADMPVVAMTGSGEDAVHKGLFNFALTKPFKMKYLLEVIRALTKNN
ncbi:MAG: response regulator [Deltaproteobacteria bacterium]|nr:MAG: response regulator [Deltaproteobacteria bacterium]